MTTVTNDLESTIDTYLSAWTEPDGARRVDLVKQVWAPAGRLVDPPLEAVGHGQISEMGAALQSQFPGHTFRRTSNVDAHHDHFRFSWVLVGPDGTPAVNGMDVGAVDADGRLQRITGFFGDLTDARSA